VLAGQQAVLCHGRVLGWTARRALRLPEVVVWRAIVGTILVLVVATVVLS
jgi:hypothetical protein